MNAQLADYKTVKETAQIWGVSIRYVNMCIADERVSGALNIGNRWLIPKDAQKPADKRKKGEL